MTMEEVADFLRIPIGTLYQQRYTRRMPGILGIKVGRHVRFRPTDIQDWLERQRDDQPS